MKSSTKNKQPDSDRWLKDWKVVRKELNEKYSYEENSKHWDQAVEIFSERLEKFYVKPLCLLIKASNGNESKQPVDTNKPEKKLEGQGFVIVTAQCALIETFAAFKEGKIYKDSKEDEIYYYKSAKLFKEFLESEELFQINFGGNDKPSVSNFYSSVRCGLLHETRTKIKWVIKADVSSYLKGDTITEKTFAAKTDGKYIVFRNQLQKALKAYFDQYKEDLKKSGETYEKLRRLFARKLDHLFDIEEKDRVGFEWWEYSNNTETIGLFNKILQIIKSFINCIYDRISAFF